MIAPFGWRALPDTRDALEGKTADAFLSLVADRSGGRHGLARVHVVRELALALGARGVAIRCGQGDADLDRQAEATLWPDARVDALADALKRLPADRLAVFDGWLLGELATEVAFTTFVALGAALEGDGEAEKRLEDSTTFADLLARLNGVIREAIFRGAGT